MLIFSKNDIEYRKLLRWLDLSKKLIEQAIAFTNGWKEPASDIYTNKSISIIIPVYYPEHLKEVINHLTAIGGYQEIILVDDSGMIEEQDYSLVELFDNVKIIYHNENLGRSTARNTGAAYAKGDILVFLDQDMFLSPDFFRLARRYYYSNKSLIFLGLRETVPFEKIPEMKNWQSPDITKDWRIKTKVMPEFIDLTVLNVGSAFNGCKPYDTIHIANATDNLKGMGVSANKTLGFWDLPSMIVSHSMAITKKDFFMIGGFPEWIQGWGGEDIVLGFMACSAHIPIFLSKCVSYQACHLPYSGSEDRKREELIKNIRYYRKWANSTDEFSAFEQNQNRKRGYIWEKK